MMMNPNILNKNPLMFFDRAVNAQRSQLLTVMADAVSECRTAADQAAELNETGQVGLLRLAEVWSAIRAKEGMGGLILEGTEAKILSDVVAQFYAYPYWSWYGFDSRVEWCACFVSWCYNQAGKSEPRFAGCEWQGVPWFQSHGQWGARGYNNLAPGDAIFFDWDLDGTADHVGIVIGTDGSRVYTVEGNSGDACKIKSYDLNYQSIKGYGLMNW